MLHLLLVSIQLTIPTMEISDLHKDPISPKTQNNLRNHSTFEEEDVLCNHCKRTFSNGIRCLGMCVADNDY